MKINYFKITGFLILNIIAEVFSVSAFAQSGEYTTMYSSTFSPMASPSLTERSPRGVIANNVQNYFSHGAYTPFKDRNESTGSFSFAQEDLTTFQARSSEIPSRYVLILPTIVLRDNGLSVGGIIEKRVQDMITVGVYGALRGIGNLGNSVAFGVRGSLLIFPALEYLLDESVSIPKLEPYLGVSSGYNFYLNGYYSFGFSHYGGFVGSRYYLGPFGIHAELGRTIDGGWGLQGGVALRFGK